MISEINKNIKVKANLCDTRHYINIARDPKHAGAVFYKVSDVRNNYSYKPDTLDRKMEELLNYLKSDYIDQINITIPYGDCNNQITEGIIFIDREVGIKARTEQLEYLSKAFPNLNIKYCISFGYAFQPKHEFDVLNSKLVPIEPYVAFIEDLNKTDIMLYDSRQDAIDSVSKWKRTATGIAKEVKKKYGKDKYEFFSSIITGITDNPMISNLAYDYLITNIFYFDRFNPKDFRLSTFKISVDSVIVND